MVSDERSTPPPARTEPVVVSISELFFHDAVVPSHNLLGDVGSGLPALMSHLPRERLGVTAMAVATTRAILDATAQYCRERAFGRPLTANQHPNHLRRYDKIMKRSSVATLSPTAPSSGPPRGAAHTRVLTAGSLTF